MPGGVLRLHLDGGQAIDAYLVFDLLGSDDGMLTRVSLDNVNISVIPAPGALLLVVIGAGAFVVWRRVDKVFDRKLSLNCNVRNKWYSRYPEAEDCNRRKK